MAGSPLDAVQKGIRDAGFTIDEITGRKLKFDYEEGEVVKRKPADKGNQYNRFNNGDLQALIINRSGATGYSAQDAEKFKNRGRRALIELESPNSIVDLMQAYGRVNRMGQLTTPEVEFIETGNPVSMYIAAIREAHLSRLSANTSADRKSNASFEGTLDLFNSVGDEVVNRYFKEHPEFLEILGFTEATFQNQEDEGAEG